MLVGVGVAGHVGGGVPFALSHNLTLMHKRGIPRDTYWYSGGGVLPLLSSLHFPLWVEKRIICLLGPPLALSLFRSPSLAPSFSVFGLLHPTLSITLSLSFLSLPPLTMPFFLRLAICNSPLLYFSLSLSPSTTILKSQMFFYPPLFKSTEAELAAWWQKWEAPCAQLHNEDVPVLKKRFFMIFERALQSSQTFWPTQ